MLLEQIDTYIVKAMDALRENKPIIAYEHLTYVQERMNPLAEELGFFLIRRSIYDLTECQPLKEHPEEVR